MVGDRRGLNSRLTPSSAQSAQGFERLGYPSHGRGHWFETSIAHGKVLVRAYDREPLGSRRSRLPREKPAAPRGAAGSWPAVAVVGRHSWLHPT